MGGKVVIIHSKSEWDAQVMTNADATYIVDFTATWCGPCRMIGPVFEELSNQFDSVVFLKVDVDEVEQVWKGGQKVDELVGAAKDKLKELVVKYAG
ncbi:hypothetical protein CHLNCDRAFT_133836 [Chlorella variabilis]|uniref:Thioredoxin domain-containing protein n=1 Tax=Chlorella variabilis TaxID=554065 RepID=E1ZFC3_CHLVA|nr:hypothetical protein CHLNCDRAFT_133836 [Chlorella variabilis]EFN55477.1 hypothetical protein CHLNCDRAFT_133836 [Chlorella variabilis]|eukprot:XP_005847579.1 hypothetical protein CHLNCDRAFT_133836 [Chlorella variabilis]